MGYKINKNKTYQNNTEPLPVFEQPKTVSNAKPVKKTVEPKVVEYYAEETESPEKAKSSGTLKFFKVTFTIVLLLLAMVPIAFSFLPDIKTVEVPKEPEKIGIIQKEEINLTEEEIVVYEEKKDEVMNILVIGVDGEGYKGVRSDVMIIMTINKSTKEIHLTSMQRDTMAYIPSKKTYEKLNHAFAYDGAVGSLTALNQNYDLDLNNFVVFDYDALRKMIKAVGGVVVDVDSSEYTALQNEGLAPAGTGQQKLTADQALMYARIRYTTGGDPGRNERQREILKYIFSTAKTMSLGQLKNLAEQILPEVLTSYSYSDVLPMLEFFQTIKDGSELVDHSFPFDKKSAMINNVSYEIPMTVATNITKLHEIVSAYPNYVPSDRAMEYHYAIGKRSGYYK